MLLQLEIKNIALIDSISIELESGLNILTGETGAGKSIIIDSINAILGDRVSKDLIRTGKEKASVQAVFQIENQKFSDTYEEIGIEPEEDGTLIISREFTLSGKNTCRVNGKIVPVSALKEIGQRIIDIHGQHDNQSLLRTESHIELLDCFGGERIQKLKQQYSILLDHYKKLKDRLKSLSGDKNERERKIDLLKFQVDEIKKAKLKVSEEEELEKQRLILSNSEKIIGSLSKAYQALFSGNNMMSSASDNVNQAVAEISAITRIDERYDEISQKLKEVSYQLEDIIEDIRKERDSVEYNPDLLETIEERMDLIYKLKRKYGSSIEEVLQYCDRTQQELEDTIQSEEKAVQVQEQLSKTNDALYEFSKAINRERIKAAEVLEAEIGVELDALEMKKARFKVDIEFDPSAQEGYERKYNQNGLDRIEFLISANAGEPLKPLAKIASGGEMSRTMLAIKTILAKVDRIPTLIFDEIDIGISGKAAQKVGEKLSYISGSHQVICVTHLAQIACMADSHFLIEKHFEGETTQTDVRKLSDSQRKAEIARIIGGAKISEITLKHAKEMLENASKIKK